MCIDNSNQEEYLLQESETNEVHFLPLDVEPVCGLTYEQQNFVDGVKSMSYLCGQITALCNCGIDPETALGYFVNLDTIKHNIEITKLQSVALDKTQI